MSAVCTETWFICNQDCMTLHRLWLLRENYKLIKVVSHVLSVTVYGVYIGNWIYLTLTACKYEKQQQFTDLYSLHFTMACNECSKCSVFSQMYSGNGFQRQTFLMIRVPQTSPCLSYNSSQLSDWLTTPNDLFFTSPSYMASALITQRTSSPTASLLLRRNSIARTAQRKSLPSVLLLFYVWLVLRLPRHCLVYRAIT
jgi:hypothetical protein